MGLNFEKIPTKDSDKEKPGNQFEKFSDWAPFNLLLTDVNFSSLEEPREVVNSKIYKLQESVLRYLSGLNIDQTEYNNKFNQIVNDFNINKAIRDLCDLIKEVTDVLRERLPEAEVVEREEWKKMFRIKEVNELVGYNDPDKYISHILNIHILPNRTTPIREKLILFRDGFRGLAQIVNSDEDIKKIVGDSWIALEKPKLVKEMGFKVENNLKDEFKRIFIEKNDKNAETVSMSREEFLKKYL